MRFLAVRDRASSIPIALLLDYYLLGICTAHHSTFRTRDLHRVLDYSVCLHAPLAHTLYLAREERREGRSRWLAVRPHQLIQTCVRETSITPPKVSLLPISLPSLT